MCRRPQGMRDADGFRGTVTTRALVALALASSGLLATPALAEIYKWVDENGNVHFSERRPADEAVERVEIRTRSPAAATTDTGDGEASDAQDDEVREVPLTPEQQAQKAAEIERLKKAHAARCEEARAQKVKMTTGGGRVLVEQADGTMATMTEEARQARLKAADEAIEESCNWSPDQLAAGE